MLPETRHVGVILAAVGLVPQHSRPAELEVASAQAAPELGKTRRFVQPAAKLRAILAEVILTGGFVLVICGPLIVPCTEQPAYDTHQTGADRIHSFLSIFPDTRMHLFSCGVVGCMPISVIFQSTIWCMHALDYGKTSVVAG